MSIVDGPAWERENRPTLPLPKTDPSWPFDNGEPQVIDRTNPKDAVADKKLPLWLLSPIAKIHWALGQAAGMMKYGAWNWRTAGVRSSIYLSALERHLEAYKSGEELDPVDGTHHLGNIMACAAIILDAREAGKLNDDRPPRVDHRPALVAAEAQLAALQQQYKNLKPHHHRETPGN